MVFTFFPPLSIIIDNFYEKASSARPGFNKNVAFSIKVQFDIWVQKEVLSQRNRLTVGVWRWNREAAQLFGYNAEVVLIPLTKLGISKTSSWVGCEKTWVGCTKTPGDLSLGRKRIWSKDCQCDQEGVTLCHPHACPAPPQCLGWRGTRHWSCVLGHGAEELGVGGAYGDPGLLPSAGGQEVLACWHIPVLSDCSPLGFNLDLALSWKSYTCSPGPLPSTPTPGSGRHSSYLHP